jgi:hypothetical protein
VIQVIVVLIRFYLHSGVTYHLFFLLTFFLVFIFPPSPQFYLPSSYSPISFPRPLSFVTATVSLTLLTKWTPSPMTPGAPSFATPMDNQVVLLFHYLAIFLGFPPVLSLDPVSGQPSWSQIRMVRVRLEAFRSVLF